MPAIPADLTESALAEWLRDNATPGNRSLLKRDWEPVARAVRELVDSVSERRVREAIRLCNERYRTECRHDIMLDDEIVARVMGAP